MQLDIKRNINVQKIKMKSQFSLYSLFTSKMPMDNEIMTKMSLYLGGSGDMCHLPGSLT